MELAIASVGLAMFCIGIVNLFTLKDRRPAKGSIVDVYHPSKLSLENSGSGFSSVIEWAEEWLSEGQVAEMKEGLDESDLEDETEMSEMAMVEYSFGGKVYRAVLDVVPPKDGFIVGTKVGLMVLVRRPEDIVISNSMRAAAWGFLYGPIGLVMFLGGCASSLRSCS